MFGLDLVAVAGTLAEALILALSTSSRHAAAISTVAGGTAATLILFGMCGVALAVVLLPAAWGPLVPLLALPLGATAWSLALTALGIVHVPLHVSLWLVLALGVASIVLVARRSRARLGGGAPQGAAPLGLSRGPVRPVLRGADSGLALWLRDDLRRESGCPSGGRHRGPVSARAAHGHRWRAADRHRAPAWRFRYPIFYPLAGVSDLAHLDPIRVFPSMAALLVVIAALGFGALAVTCLRAPPAAGPFVAGSSGWP